MNRSIEATLLGFAGAAVIAAPVLAADPAVKLRVGAGTDEISCTFPYASTQFGAESLSVICTGAPVIPPAVLATALEGVTVQIAGQEGSFTLSQTGGGTGFTLTPATGGGGGGGDAYNNKPIATADSHATSVGASVSLIDVLANDTDADGDRLTLKAVTPNGAIVGAVVTIENNKVRYTPPASLASTATDRFSYTMNDGHMGDEVVTGDLTVTITTAPATPQCDRATGGSGCFGQTWAGQWYTLAEELAGQVPGALFVPNKTAYTVAIFPNPGLARETHWGCGPEQATVVQPKSSCDYTKSLRGGVTYMLRLPVVDAQVRRTSVLVKTLETLDQIGSYVFALSKDPTRIDPANPEGGSSCERLNPTSSANFYSISCPLLTSQQWGSGTQILYLKFQAHGTTPATLEKIAKCNNGLRCAMYVDGW